jgi:hypothetical protein
MIPMDYHRYARQSAQHSIQAGEAAARHALTNPAAVHLNERRGARSLRARLFASLLLARPFSRLATASTAVRVPEFVRSWVTAAKVG